LIPKGGGHDDDDSDGCDGHGKDNNNDHGVVAAMFMARRTFMS